MYPLYWTPSKEGIFMRYSHEYKLECIELYRQGIWPETPEGIITTNFRKMIRYWVRKYKELGYNGLVNKQKGRKNPGMKKKTIEPKPLTESEREELIRLREEIAAMKAEIEVVKKRIALRKERWAAQVKAKKQQSSKRSEKKDTN